MGFRQVFLALFITGLSLLSIGQNDVLALKYEALEAKKAGNMLSSISFAKRAIQVAQVENMAEQDVVKLKSFLANRYSNIGDFDRAIELGKTLEHYYRKTGDNRRRLNTLNNLGVYHQNISRYDLAYGYFKTGWNQDKKTGDVIDQLDWLDGLASSCIKLNRLKEAQLYLEESATLLRSFKSDEKMEMQLYYFINRAQLAKAMGDKEQGLPMLKKAAHIANILGNRKGVDAMNEMAKIYLGIESYPSVIAQVTGVEKLLDIKGNPYLKDPYLLQTYTLAAKAYARQGDRARSLMMIEKAEVQAAYYHTQYMFNESKLYLDELRRINLELGVEVCYALWQETSNNEYLLAALLYADKAKSNVLNERAQVAQKMSSNSSEIRDLRFQWVYQLNAYENKGENAKALKLRDKLDSLNRTLKLSNFDDFGVSQLKEFIAARQKDEILIEYFVVDSVVYVFSIMNNSINARKVSDLDLREIVSLYYQVKQETSSITNYASFAEQTYNSLIKNELKAFPGAKKIVIVADKQINYVNFGALSTDYTGKLEWWKLPYLAKSYNISYDFSLQSIALKRTKYPVSSYAGFAPNFSNKPFLAYLSNGETSVSQASHMFRGKAFIGSEASSENLRYSGAEASVLHLYTHGVSSDSSYDASYIYMQDRKMYVDEILTLPLQTELCLLTACEVGLGKDYSGEGVTGVAWAFHGAGASNVVQSMWKLNEKTSSVLMNLFFENLNDGLSSDLALSKAKQDYLNNPEISTRLKHPYYWAGMSHYGKGTVVKKQGHTLLWYGLTGSLVLLASFVFLYLKKVRSTN
ncbi:MAG: CHAT domain-containing protein [Pseudoalteromonas distincta]|jgi:CHAT domain-containing protein